MSRPPCYRWRSGISCSEVGRPRSDGDLTLRLTRRLTEAEPVSAVLSLTYEQRSRSRLRARLDDGRAVGVLLPRGGEPLRDGDLLRDEQDSEVQDRPVPSREMPSVVVQVRAAPEPVSTAEADDPLLLARAAYHLGNRHVALQIEPGRLRWLQDHVLDAMVRGLGLTVTLEDAPFEPEPGAYAGGQHGQGGIGHEHEQGGHEHGHEHEHEHGHRHGHAH